MGHERLGALPKTRRWRQIVEQVSAAARGDTPVSFLVSETLSRVRSQFTALKSDPATNEVFATLVRIAVACRAQDEERLRFVLGQPNLSPTPLALTRLLHTVSADSNGLPEYGEIAATSAADALATWYQQAKPREQSLFESLRSPYETWRGLSSGAGFCELSRLFFARCTERYLNYFLERVASEVAPNAESREQLRSGLSAHVAASSQHAFETAKITQSFAAGWFNKNAREGAPPSEVTRAFVAYAFDKLREALEKEARPE